jgi:uncharacterized protein YqgC (DUF456 family)
MNHVILLITALILLLPGLAGVFLPFVPGIPYMFVVALLFSIADRFLHVTGGNLLILGIVTILSFLVDYLAGILGAKFGGASWKSMSLGFLGAFIGLIAVPPFGGIVGLFVGIFVGEIIRRRGARAAVRTATTGVIGSLTGMAINSGLALLFFILFLLFAIS